MAELPGLGERCQVKSCQQLGKTSFSSYHLQLLLPSVLVKVKSTVQDAFVCMFEDCSIRELLDVKCEHCQKQFCLRHRHQSDHKCPLLPKKQVDVSAEERLKAITGRELSHEKKGRTGVKNEARRLKVALMKMKMSAVGDSSIPQIWTGGKVLDKICSNTGLVNENNISGKKKLCLVKTDRLLPLDQSLEQLASSEELQSGSDVILKYIDNS